MAVIPILHRLEKQFPSLVFNKWFEKNWTISVYFAVIYLVLVYVGTQFMKNKQSYSLKRPLFLWNVGLAVFSLYGTSVVIPSMYNVYLEKGFVGTVCWSDRHLIPFTSFWGMMFSVSKVLELFDTMFLVLRKRPVIFLHYYHHATVLVYVWWSHAYPSALTHWASFMNYNVHTIMYTYYALAAAGVRFPSIGTQLITSLQLLQMFMGLLFNYVAISEILHGGECMYTWNQIYVAAILYGSYAVLFGQYFYGRYISQKKPKQS